MGWSGLGLGVALALPSVAEAAGTAETVAAAKASPLLRKELRRDQLQAAGLATITPTPGVTMDFQAWVRDTALDTRPELAPLLDPKLPKGLLSAAPVYAETILELEDRLVVERKLTVPLAAGACARADKPAAVAELCFTKNPANKADKGVQAELKAIRGKLAAAPGDKVVRGAVTAAQALQMTDEQLLDLMLNTGARTIHQVSVVPRVPVQAGGLQQFGTKLKVVPLDPGLQLFVPAGVFDPKVLDPVLVGASHTYARDYFLTGFTYGREIEDSWEYTFADETFFTDRYYVRVDYHIGLGFGVRAPFAVDVKATSTGADARSVDVSVEPVNVDANGAPAYQAVGLPGNQTFGGKEFVLEFKAGCRLYVSMPGPNIDRSCPSIDLDYSRDINPVLGTERSQIGDWWLDGSVTGLKVSVAVASASLDVGVGAEVTNGRVGVRALGVNGGTVGGGGNLAFTTRSPRRLTVSRAPGVAGAALRLDRPTYGFDIRVTPKLRGKIELDIAIYEKTWYLGPWALDVLSISQNFQLTHHAGTVANHDYEVFKVANPEAAAPAPKALPKAMLPK